MNKSVRRLLIGVPLVLALSSAAFASEGIDWPASGSGTTASAAAGVVAAAPSARGIDWPAPGAKVIETGSTSMHGDVIDWP
ncbi:hypothetical protein IPZ58_15995 [Streptomyces roseoverticillatus]|uniref:hypothetical protein n=1 Tax=Streptomyces roseoverticillatus TaxID=66429 RepID=UPI001F322553|nr:hypothetical protein [Streptomyces roseoverticillatus]MCF3103077.1 hypothetical protein [Streptomyces roseoverticillatus]